MSQTEEEFRNDKNDEFDCSNCGKVVNEDDDFCPHCGSIFSEDVYCDKHNRTEASGVCVICGLPCCDECGTVVNEYFLCNHHSNYEIFEGMVKVFSTNDSADAEFAKSRLDEAGLHTTLLHSHRFRGMKRVEYEIYEGEEEFNAREIKVMVHCGEVADAESVLKEPPAIN
ncbi:MAG: zinc-ribbon domain-containing protein [Bacteroidetes bacterium]|nr:zinc-ribbon domain-containing protein [Bacteroidota bacterium]MCL5739182.1 zinc-ribbon domain-containing protein [Bacteroidota bacterium]